MVHSYPGEKGTTSIQGVSKAFAFEGIDVSQPVN
jgi:hypothetical protein